MRVHNGPGRNGLYLVRRGARLHTGTWAITRCGAPYNDGASVMRITGRHSTVSRIAPVGVARCAHPAGRSDVDRYAARFACGDR